MDTPSYDVLYGYLSPEFASQLAQTGSLPADIHDHLARVLKRTRTGIAAYVPEIILRAQILDPQPGRISGNVWNGSLLMADMSGFTALSEQLSSLGRQGAEELSTIINRLFGVLVGEVQQAGGTVLKFGGDGLTAFFDAQKLGDMHGAAAAVAGLALQQRMQQFSTIHTRVGTFRLRLRVGIHSGHIFAAEIGDLSHIETVFTGPAMITVAQAQEAAVPGEVIVSSATAALIPSAFTAPAQAGFLRLQRLTNVDLPVSDGDLLQWPAHPDLATMVRCANQISALRPYLVRNLPSRFLDADAEELGDFRLVSTLFIHLHNFDALFRIGLDDPLFAAKVMNTCIQRLQTIIHRYDGVINKIDTTVQGTRILAMFGAPIAHEEDPLRATRCALDIRDELTAIRTDIMNLIRQSRAAKTVDDTMALSQRSGLNTGIVFAGRVGRVSDVRRYEYTVLGATVNLAARLAAVAEEQTILLAPATHAIVGSAISTQEMMPIHLKGLSTPVTPYRALNPGIEQRSWLSDTVSAVSMNAPLIGRNEELAQLLQAGNRALHGEGKMMEVVGEAGVGKTRLLEELLYNLVIKTGDEDGPPSFVLLGTECQGYDQNAAYITLRNLLMSLCGLAMDAPPALLVERLSQRLIELLPELERSIPLLGDFTGVVLEENTVTSLLVPEQRHKRLTDMLVRLFIAEAQQQPMIVLVDDTHWADTASREVIAELASYVGSAPIFVILSYRPDSLSEPIWGDPATDSRILLHELDTDESAQLVQALLGAAPLEELTTLLKPTQGNPFFIEEYLRNLVESGTLVRDGDGWHLSRPLESLVPPSSIEAVIGARLDRLSDQSRNVIQIAAIIGRRFTVDLLQDVLDKTTNAEEIKNINVEEIMNLLSDTGLIIPDANETERSFQFRQALIHDTVYDTVLYARRRNIHRLVALQIEARYADRLEPYWAVLGRHYEKAEDWPQAREYYMSAGQQAQKRYANREALELFQSAFKAWSSAIDPDPLMRVTLLEHLGDVTFHTGQLAQSATYFEEAIERYRALRLPDHVRLLSLLQKSAFCYERGGMIVEANEKILQSQLVMEYAPITIESARVLRRVSMMYSREGNYHGALEYLTQALAISEDLGQKEEQCTLLRTMGGIHWKMGNMMLALEFFKRSLDLAEQLNDLMQIADVNNEIANVYLDLGDFQESKRCYAACVELAAYIGDIHLQALVGNNLGDLLLTQRKLHEAAQEFRKSLELYLRLDVAPNLVYVGLGETYLLLGDSAQGEEHIAQAYAASVKQGDFQFLPDIRRLEAEIIFVHGDKKEALLANQRAMEVALEREAVHQQGLLRQQKARFLSALDRYKEAWVEVEQSLTIWQSMGIPHEVARSHVLLAEIAPYLDRWDEGQDYLLSAYEPLARIESQMDIDRIVDIATRHGYNLPPQIQLTTPDQVL